MHQNKEVRARRAYQKRERKRERMDGASSSSSSSSDDDDTVGGGVGDKSLDSEEEKENRVCEHPSCSQKRE